MQRSSVNNRSTHTVSEQGSQTSGIWNRVNSLSSFDLKDSLWFLVATVAFKNIALTYVTPSGNSMLCFLASVFFDILIIFWGAAAVRKDHTRLGFGIVAYGLVGILASITKMLDSTCQGESDPAEFLKFIVL